MWALFNMFLSFIFWGEPSEVVWRKPSQHLFLGIRVRIIPCLGDMIPTNALSVLGTLELSPSGFKALQSLMVVSAKPLEVRLLAGDLRAQLWACNEECVSSAFRVASPRGLLRRGGCPAVPRRRAARMSDS